MVDLATTPHPPPPFFLVECCEATWKRSVNIVHTNWLCLVKPGMDHAAVYLRLLA